MGRRLEASRGDLAFEVVELCGLQSAWIPFVVQGLQRLESAALVEFQPVSHGAAADAKELRAVVERPALIQPEQNGQAVVDADVFLLATKFFDLLAE